MAARPMTLQTIPLAFWAESREDAERLVLR
jgi:hypothetical protein